MVSSSDHITGAAGLSPLPTVTLSKNGAAFSSGGGTVTAVGNGVYSYAPTVGDTDTLGSLMLHATASTADPVDLEFEVVAFDPRDSVRMGQTALPNVAAGALNGLPLSADTVGRVDVLKINGTSQTARDIGASVLLSSGTGTGQVNLSLGRVGINWADVQNPTTAVNLSGTTISTSQAIASVSGAVGSVTGNVSGNVVGSVGSVTGAVGSVTGAVGSVTGDVGGKVLGGGVSTITGDGVRAASVTGNVGGNVNGNVVGSVASVTGNVGGNVVGNVNGNVVGSVASVTGNVGGNVTGSVGSVSNPASISAAVWDEGLAGHTNSSTFGGRIIRSKTGSVSDVEVSSQNHISATVHDMQAGVLTASVIAAGAIDSNAIAASAANEIADAILARNIGGGSSTGRTVTEALRFLRNKFSVVSGTLTVYQEDDTTVSWTGTVGTTAGADPITSNDPA